MPEPVKKTRKLIKVLHKPQFRVAKCWLISKIICLTIAALGGIMMCVSSGRITNCFCGDCFLNAKILLTENGSMTEDSKWGRLYDCRFCEYVPMTSACFAILAAVMFVQCKNLDSGRNSTPMRNNPSWMLVVPSLPLVFIMFVLSAVTLDKFLSGSSKFCRNALMNNVELGFTQCQQIYPLMQEAVLSQPSAVCNSAGYYKARIFDACSDPDTFATNIIVATVGGSLHLVGWALMLIILGGRCVMHADFDIKVKSYQTAPENPKTLKRLPSSTSSRTEPARRSSSRRKSSSDYSAKSSSLEDVTESEPVFCNSYPPAYQLLRESDV